MVQDEVIFFGHKNVRSLHAKTIEITKESHLTLRGDCIIGVSANKACSDLDPLLQNRLKQNNSLVKIEIIVANQIFEISGKGDERLSLLNKHDIVTRKTSFVCPRTLIVGCDMASSEVPRSMVQALQNSETKGLFRITAE